MKIQSGPLPMLYVSQKKAEIIIIFADANYVCQFVLYEIVITIRT